MASAASTVFAVGLDYVQHYKNSNTCNFKSMKTNKRKHLNSGLCLFSAQKKVVSVYAKNLIK